MRTISKLLNWIAWISAGLGFVFLILGLINVAYAIARPLFNVFPGDFDSRLYGDTEVINMFIASTTFFVITIAMILLLNKSESKGT